LKDKVSLAAFIKSTFHDVSTFLLVVVALAPVVAPAPVVDHAPTQLFVVDDGRLGSLDGACQAACLFLASAVRYARASTRVPRLTASLKSSSVR